MSIILESVSQVYYKYISEMYHNKENVYNFSKKLIIKLLFIGIPAFIIFSIMAPKLFSFILGAQWETSGVYSQYLTPWLFTTFIVSPFAFIPIVYNKQGKALYLELINIILRFTGVIIGSYFNSIIITLLSFSILSAFVTLYRFSWYLSITKQNNQYKECFE